MKKKIDNKHLTPTLLSKEGRKRKNLTPTLSKGEGEKQGRFSKGEGVKSGRLSKGEASNVMKVMDIKSACDLTDEEIEELRSENGEIFPKLNSKRKALFDANANMTLSNDEQDEMVRLLERKFCEVMDILRITRNDPNVTHTPIRIARMFVHELFAGRYEKPPNCTVFPNRKKVDELIISKGIEVMSVCSHHWQVISGECAIGYIPGDYILGLSKFTRIVDWFSRRGQIQEELGEQIADYIVDLIKPKALGVVIKATHFCMVARGVKGSEDKAKMVTSVMRGYLLEDFNLRNEFLKLIT